MGNGWESFAIPNRDVKLYTGVIDELMVNQWNSWFEWPNRVTLHSVQGETVPVSSLFAGRKIRWNLLLVEGDLLYSRSIVEDSRIHEVTWITDGKRMGIFRNTKSSNHFTLNVNILKHINKVLHFNIQIIISNP
jgi:hypothetical protein